MGAAARVGEGRYPLSLLLRITAVVSLAWAVLLLTSPNVASGMGPIPPVQRALANGLAIANVVFAYLFWYAAARPSANRGAIYAALLLLVLRVANDLYELLVLLPGQQALVSLADLVVSVALLVGILEALPRLLRGQSAT